MDRSTRPNKHLKGLAFGLPEEQKSWEWAQWNSFCESPNLWWSPIIGPRKLCKQPRFSTYDFPFENRRWMVLGAMCYCEPRPDSNTQGAKWTQKSLIACVLSDTWPPQWPTGVAYETDGTARSSSFRRHIWGTIHRQCFSEGVPFPLNHYDQPSHQAYLNNPIPIQQKSLETTGTSTPPPPGKKTPKTHPNHKKYKPQHKKQTNNTTQPLRT